MSEDDIEGAGQGASEPRRQEMVDGSPQKRDDSGPTAADRRAVLAAMATIAGTPVAGAAFATGAHRTVLDRLGTGDRSGPRSPDPVADDEGPGETERAEPEPPDHPAAFIRNDLEEVCDESELNRYAESDWEANLVETPPGFEPASSMRGTLNRLTSVNCGFTRDRQAIWVGFQGYFTRPVLVGVNLLSPTFDRNEYELDPSQEYPIIENRYVDPDEHHRYQGDLDGQQTFFARVDATGERRKPEAQDFVDYRLRFDMNGAYEFPEDVSTHFHVVLQDAHWQESEHFERSDFPYYLLAHRTHLKLSYRVPDGGSATRWIWNLQDHPKTPLELYRKSNATFETFHVSGDGSPDRNGDYAVTYEVIPTPDGFWAAGITNDRQAMERYRENGGDGTYHQLQAANRAHTRPKWRFLARQLWDAQTRLGITDVLDRVNGVAQYAQVIQYAYGNIREYGRTTGWRKPAFHLYDRIANCSSKTAIFAAILRCQPFGVRVGYLACDLVDLGPHMVGGVFLDHLRDTDHDLSGLDTITVPDDVDAAPGVPAGEYAFVELTDPSRDVGEYDPERYELRGFYDTNYGENSRA